MWFLTFASAFIAMQVWMLAYIVTIYYTGPRAGYAYVRARASCMRMQLASCAGNSY